MMLISCNSALFHPGLTVISLQSSVPHSHPLGCIAIQRYKSVIALKAGLRITAHYDTVSDGLRMEPKRVVALETGAPMNSTPSHLQSSTVRTSSASDFSTTIERCRNIHSEDENITAHDGLSFVVFTKTLFSLSPFKRDMSEKIWAYHK